MGLLDKIANDVKGYLTSPAYSQQLAGVRNTNPQNWVTVRIDLGTARTGKASEVFGTPGDTIIVESITGTASLVTNSLENMANQVSLNRNRRISTVFSEFWIINTAQAGKVLTLQIGRDASFDSSPLASTGVLDAAGSDINPAEAATTPVIYNIAIANGTTEYSQAITGTIKKYTIHSTDGTAFRMAFVTGKVAAPTAPYWTIGANLSFSDDGLKAVNPTFYFGMGGGAGINKVVELLVWS